MTLCTGGATESDNFPVESPAAPRRRLVHWWTPALLLGAAALDLARCAIDMTANSAPQSPRLMTLGALAATVSALTALGCLRGVRWVSWPAFLIGVASAPQAAATGFQAAYAVPDVVTAAVGILLMATILAGDVLLGHATDR